MYVYIIYIEERALSIYGPRNIFFPLFNTLSNLLIQKLYLHSRGKAIE